MGSPPNCVSESTKGEMGVGTGSLLPCTHQKQNGSNLKWKGRGCGFRRFCSKAVDRRQTRQERLKQTEDRKGGGGDGLPKAHPKLTPTARRLSPDGGGANCSQRRRRSFV